MTWVPFDATEPISEIKVHENAILIRSQTRAVVFDCIRGSYGPVLQAGTELTDGAIS